MSETSTRDDNQGGANIGGESVKYCQECGNEISEKAKICPKCGVEQPDTEEESDRSQRAKKFLIAGAILGAVSIIILPIVFAPLAGFCGILAMYYGRPLAGAAIVAWAVIAFFIGIILGVIGFAMM